jgi:hypothetical protein
MSGFDLVRYSAHLARAVLQGFKPLSASQFAMRVSKIKFNSTNC